ncbi:MAG: hypothetical protein AABY85_02190 [Gemmatimonadota bacterium]
MAGIKLSAKAAEEYEFLESVLKRCDHITALVEQYAGANKGADLYLSQMTRALAQIRQQAMIKNLGFVADHAGMLGVAAGRGSQMQRSRTIREGSIALKQLIERTMKAIVETDKREKGEKEKEKEKQAASGSH